MNRVAIVRSNSGNIVSVANALDRLGAAFSITDNADEIASADRVVFPGVGEASSAMCYLADRGLDVVLKKLKQPVLAICLGMQLLGEYSDENDTPCLGIIPGMSRRMVESDLKVPHIGWNNIRDLRTPLFNDVPENSRVYFVHSYSMEKSEHTIAECEYGSTFSSAVARDNFYGVQFHPEKSGTVGATILKNFLEIERL